MKVTRTFKANGQSFSAEIDLDNVTQEQAVKFGRSVSDELCGPEGDDGTYWKAVTWYLKQQ